MKTFLTWIFPRKARGLSILISLWKAAILFEIDTGHRISTINKNCYFKLFSINVIFKDNLILRSKCTASDMLVVACSQLRY